MKNKDFKRKERYSNHIDDISDRMIEIGDRMFEIGDNMFKIFDEVDWKSRVSSDDRKTIIKRNGKTIVIDGEGTISVDGNVVYDIQNNFTSEAKEYNTEDEVLDAKEIKKIIKDFDVRLKNLYWYLVFGCMISSSLSILFYKLIM